MFLYSYAQKLAMFKSPHRFFFVFYAGNLPVFHHSGQQYNRVTTCIINVCHSKFLRSWLFLVLDMAYVGKINLYVFAPSTVQYTLPFSPCSLVSASRTCFI